MAKRKMQGNVPLHGPQQKFDSDVELVGGNGVPEKQYEHAEYRAINKDYLPGDIAFRHMAAYETLYVGRGNIHTSLAVLLDNADAMIHDPHERVAKLDRVARHYLGADLGLDALVQEDGAADQKRDALQFLVALEKGRSRIADLAKEYRLKIEEAGILLSEEETQSIERHVKRQR